MSTYLKPDNYDERKGAIVTDPTGAAAELAGSPGKEPGDGHPSR